MDKNIDRFIGQFERCTMICCVTGHRPEGFPFPRDPYDPPFAAYRDRLSDEIEGLIHQGYIHFITGMARGADLDFAEFVIFLRDVYPSIILEAALPYHTDWGEKKRHCTGGRELVMFQCNLKHTVSDHYFRGCMDKRNRYMVDKSDLVLAIWNGQESGGTWNTIKYARSKGKPIRYIMIKDFVNVRD